VAAKPRRGHNPQKNGTILHSYRRVMPKQNEKRFRETKSPLKDVATNRHLQLTSPFSDRD
jgi:hypothetical protein